MKAHFITRNGVNYGFAFLPRRFWYEHWLPLWHEGRGVYMSVGLWLIAFYRGYLGGDMPIEQVGFTEERKKMLEYRMERAIKAEGVTIGCDGACLDIMVFADEITLVFTMSPEEAMFFAMQIMDTVMTTQD